jgi:hypothetical protein
MFAATDTEFAPRHVPDSNSKKHARLNIISHLLKQISVRIPTQGDHRATGAGQATRLPRARPLPSYTSQRGTESRSIGGSQTHS